MERVTATMTVTVSILPYDAPRRPPDGDYGEGSFFFWLGDDGVKDDPEWDADEVLDDGAVERVS